MIRPTILQLVENEIDRQSSLKAAGKFKYTTNELHDVDAFAVCAEEFGEIAGAISEHFFKEGCITHPDVRDELIQLCACAMRWLDAYDDDSRPKYYNASPYLVGKLLGSALALEQAARVALATFDVPATNHDGR